MKRELLHIYGPFSINSYGLMIALSVLVFTWLIHRDPRFKKLHLKDTFFEILILGIISGVVGGRILWLLSEPAGIEGIGDLFAVWQGGLSLLGCILGVLLTVPTYLYIKKIPIIPFLDLIGLYAPIIESISRLGCFFAGCCYGQPTQVPWGVIYTDPLSIAPLNVCIHPTQLYTAILALGVFALQYFVLQKYLVKTGQLLFCYLMFASIIRFIVDFWRDDRVFSPMFQIISVYQAMALVIFVLAAIGFIVSSLYESKPTTPEL